MVFKFGRMSGCVVRMKWDLIRLGQYDAVGSSRNTISTMSLPMCRFRSIYATHARVALFYCPVCACVCGVCYTYLLGIVWRVGE